MTTTILGTHYAPSPEVLAGTTDPDALDRPDAYTEYALALDAAMHRSAAARDAYAATYGTPWVPLYEAVAEIERSLGIADESSPYYARLARERAEHVESQSTSARTNVARPR